MDSTLLSTKKKGKKGKNRHIVRTLKSAEGVGGTKKTSSNEKCSPGLPRFGEKGNEFFHTLKGKEGGGKRRQRMSLAA